MTVTTVCAVGRAIWFVPWITSALGNSCASDGPPRPHERSANAAGMMTRFVPAGGLGPAAQHVRPDVHVPAAASAEQCLDEAPYAGAGPDEGVASTATRIDATLPGRTCHQTRTAKAAGSLEALMSADAALLEVTCAARRRALPRHLAVPRAPGRAGAPRKLKVRYKGSILGFAWSLLNPLLYLVVFYIVFQVFLGSGIPSFPIFLLSGLLVWNLFVGSLPAATGSIIDNGSLVKKVWFPREILPLASVGAALVHFFLQSLVLFAAIAIVRYPLPWGYVWMIVPGLVTLLVLTAALGVLLSAVSVYARDIRHLLELVLLAWFWMTPIVYPYELVAGKLGSNSWLALLNPMTPVVLCFQRGIYGKVYGPVQSDGTRQAILPDMSQWWYLRNVLIVLVLASVLLVVAVRVFDRLEGSFAEEI